MKLHICAVAVFVSLYWISLVESRPASDFLTPDEYERIKNSKLTTSPPKFSVPPPKTDYSSRIHSDDEPVVWESSPLQVSSSNAGAHASNVHGGKEQDAGANTYNHNVENKDGKFHNSGASSIGSNLSQDGKTGQLAATNIQKQTSHTADGFKHQESSLSQSANFDRNTGSLLATNANTDVKHTVDKTGEKREMSSGSSATNQNQFGTSNSNAQTNTVEYNQGGKKGSSSNSAAQSTNIGKDGSLAGANANTGSNTYITADGLKVTENKASASSQHQGQNGNSASGSNCGSAGVNQGGGLGGAYSFSSSSSSSSSSFGGNGQTQSSSGCQSGSVNGVLPSPHFYPFVPFQPFG